MARGGQRGYGNAGRSAYLGGTRGGQSRAVLAASGGFLPITGAALSSAIESNTVTLANLVGTPAMSITGGQFSKNGGAYTSTATTVQNGDTVKVRVTSSSANSSPVSAVLTIDTSTRTFTVTTAAAAVVVPGTPTIAFGTSSASATEGNSGTSTVSNTINVVRNGVTGDLVVNIAYSGTASGADYSSPTSITVLAANSSVTFNTTVNGDTDVEPDETIIMTATLAAYPTSSSTKTITVLNDDATAGAPTVSSAAAAPSDPRVGIASTGTPATFTGADSVVSAIYAEDGSKLADGTSYTPVGGDFNKVLEFRSTATSAGGTTVSRAYAPVTAQFDSMTGSDGTLITAHTGEHGTTWQKNSFASYAGDAIIAGNKLGRGATSNVMVFGFTPPTAAYVVEADYTTGSAVVAGGAISFRQVNGAATFYSFGMSSTSAWGMTKRSGNTVRTSDLTGVAPYDQAPFSGNTFSASGGTIGSAVRIAANTTYAVAIHVWDEGSATQIAVYVNGCLVIRVQDADATRLTAAGNVGWYDTQSAAVTSTTGNRVSNMRVHLGRMATALRADGTNPNTTRIDEKPMQAIAPAGSLDLRGVARAYAANDNGTYTRNVGGWCEGGTTDIKVRVEKAVGGDTVVDYVTPTNLTIAGPRWFGTIDLPRNKPTANSNGDAWDVLKFRAYRGSTIVRTGTSARFANGIGLTFVGSSIAAVFADNSHGPNGMQTGVDSFPAANLTPNKNTANYPRYTGTYFFYLTGSDHQVVAERSTPDFAPYGWKIAYNGAVGANVYMDRMQAEFGGIVFSVSGGVGGSSISGADTSGWLDGQLYFNNWRSQMLAIGGVNIVTEDFGINEGRQQTANSGVLTSADMLGRWNGFHVALRALTGFAAVPLIVKGSPSDTLTTVTSGANNPPNNRHARQAEILAVAYDAATYRGPAQFDVTRYDGLHPHFTLPQGTQMVGARLAEQSIALLKGTVPARLYTASAAKVSNTQTRFTIAGVTSDALSTRDGTPGWEIATGSDLDAGALAVSASVYEGTTGGNATYLVTHASTAGAAYRAGYGEAPGQGVAGLTSTNDTTSLRDTRATYPRAVEQTAGGLAVAA
jgi:hypothetical protein